ncbi:MAG: GntR family transcriptional regulator [Bacteroidota bacterium]
MPTPKSLYIDRDSPIPKYRQVANTILWEIEQEVLKKGDKLPSINEASAEFYLSRDTVEKAYRELVHRGVVSSIPGKGFFIRNRPERAKLKIVLILNKLSPYKLQIHEALVERMGEEANTTIFLHNYQARRFQSFVLDNLGLYDYYIISPHFQDDPEIAFKTIGKIPTSKLILLDKDLPNLNKGYGLIYQDYAKDIIYAVQQAREELSKYQKIFLVFPRNRLASTGIKSGFSKICEELGFTGQVVPSLQELELKKNSAYIVINEDDLLHIIKSGTAKGWKSGEDYGVISYNDSPTKEILAGGVSVFSTNHAQMGILAAEMILKRKHQKMRNPFVWLPRNSL